MPGIKKKKRCGSNFFIAQYTTTNEHDATSTAMQVIFLSIQIYTGTQGIPTTYLCTF